MTTAASNPYLPENPFRRHDVAIQKWFETSRVDYGMINGAVRNNVPPFVVIASPDRAFAEFGLELEKRQWITGVSEEEMKRKIQEQTTVLLPLISVYRTGFSEDKEFAGGPKTFYQRFYNYLTGKWDMYQWPTLYRFDYNVIVWSRSDYTNEHLGSWIESQLNAPGSAQGEVQIPVDHAEPFGTLYQSLRRFSMSDASDLEGSGKRMIRTDMNFSLRASVFKKAVSAGPVLGTELEIIRIDSGVKDVVETLEFLPSPPPTISSGNLFIDPLPSSQVPLFWPKVGAAQTSIIGSSYAPKHRNPQPIAALRSTVTTTDDAVLLVKAPTFASPVTVVGFQFLVRSDNPATLQIVQSDNDAETPVVVRSINLPSAPWAYFKGYVTVFSSLLGVHVQGAGTEADVDLSRISIVTYAPSAVIAPSATASTGTSITATFSGLRPAPHLLVAASFGSFSGTLRAYAVGEENVSATTSPNEIQIASGESGAAIPFIPGQGEMILFRLVASQSPIATPAYLFAFPFVF